MNTRSYNVDPGSLLEQGKEILTATDESRFHFKVFAVNMVLAGCAAAQIGAMAGISRATVSSWVKTVDEHGFAALKTDRHPGRPSRLSPGQLAEIDGVLQENPQDYGFRVWDGPSLSAYITGRYGISLGVRQCQRLFHELGYSHIRRRASGHGRSFRRPAVHQPDTGTDKTQCQQILNRESLSGLSEDQA